MSWFFAISIPCIESQAMSRTWETSFASSWRRSEKWGNLRTLGVSAPRGPKNPKWVCLKMGYTPNEIAIFHRDNDQQNHWVQWGTQHFQTNPKMDLGESLENLRSPMVAGFLWPWRRGRCSVAASVVADSRSQAVRSCQEVVQWSEAL